MGAFAGGLWFAYVEGMHRAGGAADIPLIRADTSPMKVKPENPGGMQIPDRDMLIYGQQRPQVEHLLPPPEQPMARPSPPPPPPAPSAPPVQAATAVPPPDAHRSSPTAPVANPAPPAALLRASRAAEPKTSLPVAAVADKPGVSRQPALSPAAIAAAEELGVPLPELRRTAAPPPRLHHLPLPHIAGAASHATARALIAVIVGNTPAFHLQQARRAFFRVPERVRAVLQRRSASLHRELPCSVEVSPRSPPRAVVLGCAGEDLSCRRAPLFRRGRSGGLHPVPPQLRLARPGAPAGRGVARQRRARRCAGADRPGRRPGGAAAAAALARLSVGGADRGIARPAAPRRRPGSAPG